MSEPTQQARTQEPEPEGGAMWAMLIGGAILVIAGLLIFWPGGDRATSGGKPGGRPGGSQSQSSQASAGGAGGVALGVAPGDADPARARDANRVSPGILPGGNGSISLAPPSPPQPEPTSFASVAEELRYYEKKLERARQDLSLRSTFVERSKKARDAANSTEAREQAERRHQVVEQNYNTANQTVTELEKKVTEIKQRQAAGAN